MSRAWPPADRRTGGGALALLLTGGGALALFALMHRRQRRRTHLASHNKPLVTPRTGRLEWATADRDELLAELEAMRLEAKSSQEQARALRRELLAARGAAAGGPKVHRVVLTGGPCGGKTTALTQLRARLSELGFLVLCVPEMATMLFSNGCPFPNSDVSKFAIQRGILQLQLAVEDIFAGVAKGLGKDCVLVCDRGTMDGKAYLTEPQWLQMLDELSLLPERLRDRRYDAVVHLVTAADGAEAFYTLANNKARSETAEQAKTMDMQTQQVWVGHPSYQIFDNSTAFDDKVRKAVHFVSKACGVEVGGAGYRYRKYLVAISNSSPLPTAKEVRRAVGNCEEFEISTAFLLKSGTESARVRKRTQGASVTFQKQTRLRDEKGYIYDQERMLSTSEYFELLSTFADPDCAEVTQSLLTFTFSNYYWRLVRFAGSRIAFVHVEAPTDSEFDVHAAAPPLLKLDKEVTDDHAWDTRAIAMELKQQELGRRTRPTGLRAPMQSRVPQRQAGAGSAAPAADGSDEGAARGREGIDQAPASPRSPEKARHELSISEAVFELQRRASPDFIRAGEPSRPGR
jgi:predicted ATPase